MIVDDFYIMGIALAPDKADAPLIVDSDAILAAPAARELFQPIAWRNAEVRYCPSGIQNCEFAIGPMLHVSRQTTARLPGEDLFRPLTLERPDHGTIITWRLNVVKRYYSFRITLAVCCRCVRHQPGWRAAGFASVVTKAPDSFSASLGAFLNWPASI